MRTDDIAVFEDLLRRMVRDIGSVLRDAQCAIEILEARRQRGRRADAGDAFVTGLLDEGRRAVCWNGAECHLGPTILYQLFRRLAISPNQYLTHEALLDDVWGGAPRSASAVRSAVHDLRKKLTESGMPEIADAIDGKGAGHYALLLGRVPESGGPNRKPTRT